MLPHVQRPFFLRGPLVFDGERKPDFADVYIRDGRIADVLAKGATPPADAETIALEGWLVTPGLVDAHTHLLMSGDGAYETELLKVSLPLRTLRGAHHAKLALERGVTTVRDVCTEGAGYADVALRDAIDAKLIDGPRILASGLGLGITGGYLPMGMADHVCVPSGCMRSDGPDDARRAVREQVSHGVDWIKVFADWRSTDPITRARVDRPTFTRDELSAVVDEAVRRGRRVAAHACTEEGARLALECGVHSLEHIGPFSDSTLELARDRGVFIAPTLSAFEHVAYRKSDANGRPFAEKRFLDARAAVVRAHEKGVRIVLGTDVGVFPHDKPLAELRLLVDAGLGVLDVLRAATSSAAGALGVPSIGRIAKGYEADLCAFAIGNPKEPLRAAIETSPALVWKSGRLVKSANHVPL